MAAEYHHFPTSFAKALVIDVNLFFANVFEMTSQDKNFSLADEYYGRVIDFQKLSLFNNFEDSLIAYHGVKLSTKQKAALEIVHASSKTWALGHVAETLMKRLEDDPKQVAGIAQIIFEQLNEKEGGVSEGVKRYVVNLAQVV